MVEAFGVLEQAIVGFVDVIYTPLVEYFDIISMVLLLVPVYLSFRFLILPFIGGRAIEKRDNKVVRESDSTELREM